MKEVQFSKKCQAELVEPVVIDENPPPTSAVAETLIII
jgi:hypothetical protein